MVIVEVKLKPNAKKSEILGFKENILLVSVKEQPIEGKANASLIKLLSKKLKIAKSCIKFKSGEKSKTKKLVIDCIEKETFTKMLGG